MSISGCREFARQFIFAKFRSQKSTDSFLCGLTRRMLRQKFNYFSIKISETYESSRIELFAESSVENENEQMY